MKNPIYSKDSSGSIVELVPNAVDASLEKHVPVITETDEGVLVSVGSEPHPMISKHFIMWIEVQTDTEIQRKYLKPGDAPEATFNLPADGLVALAYCNIHGLWISK
jgi:superoxide reductase